MPVLIEHPLTPSSPLRTSSLGNQKAAERGIGLDERGTVNGEDVNIGGFDNVLS